MANEKPGVAIFRPPPLVSQQSLSSQPSFAEHLELAGFNPFELPLQQHELISSDNEQNPVEQGLIDQNSIDQSTWIFSSANAVAALGQHKWPKAKPREVLAVGSATAAALAQHGLQASKVGDSGLASLVDEQSKEWDKANTWPSQITYFCAESPAVDIRAHLETYSTRTPKIAIHPLYRTNKHPNAEANVRKAANLSKISFLSFFSRRNVLIFKNLVNTSNALNSRLSSKVAVAASSKIADSLNGLAFNEVVVAKRPKAEDVIDCLKAAMLARQ